MNEPPNQLEWFIRACSGVDSGQCVLCSCLVYQSLTDDIYLHKW